MRQQLQAKCILDVLCAVNVTVRKLIDKNIVLIVLILNSQVIDNIKILKKNI